MKDGDDGGDERCDELFFLFRRSRGERDPEKQHVIRLSVRRPLRHIKRAFLLFRERER